MSSTAHTMTDSNISQLKQHKRSKLSPALPDIQIEPIASTKIEGGILDIKIDKENIGSLGLPMYKEPATLEHLFAKSFSWIPVKELAAYYSLDRKPSGRKYPASQCALEFEDCFINKQSEEPHSPAQGTFSLVEDDAEDEQEQWVFEESKAYTSTSIRTQKRYKACDACHTARRACVKNPEIVECFRCQENGLQCVFSLRGSRTIDK
jgi:hypothetical protein